VLLHDNRLPDPNRRVPALTAIIEDRADSSQAPPAIAAC
jgi:hypothetical protein